MIEMDINLRALEPEDAELLYKIENDSAAWQYSDTVAPLSKSLLRDYATNYDADPWRAGQLRLLAETNDDGNSKTVAVLDLFDISIKHQHAKVGIYVIDEFRNKHIGAKGLNLLVKYAKEVLGLRALLAEVAECNNEGKALFISAGWETIGQIPNWFFVNRKFQSVLIYSKDLERYV